MFSSDSVSTSSRIWPYLIGGVIPSILLGVSTVLMKLSLKNGISLPHFMTVIGITITIFGCIAAAISSEPAKTMSLGAGGYAILMGIAWAAATLSLSYGVAAFKLPVSVVAPLTNSNALVAVLMSCVIFSEWKNLEILKLAIGTLMIVGGATIVSLSIKSS